jgi:hypothetical protein
MIAATVYLMCALTSVLCAVLLLGKYRASKVRLLFWSALCFVGLALNNVLLFVDIVIVPRIDLSSVRALPALAGIAVLLWGFIWDSE